MLLNLTKKTAHLTVFVLIIKTLSAASVLLNLTPVHTLYWADDFEVFKQVHNVVATALEISIKVFTFPF